LDEANGTPLEKPRDWLDWYLYHTGKSEVPKQFHLWAGLSLLAAVVMDRVWIERDRANRLYPNLYVFLIGPSGSGKERAINTAVKFVADLDQVNVYAGMATKQAIIEYFAIGAESNGRVRHCINPHVYFVTEELGMAMRPGELAHDLITLMTGMYVRPPIPITEGTRGNGFVQIVEPCINWMAGTTESWLLKSIPRDAIEGGFFARVINVRGRRNYAERCAEITYPDDYDEVKTWLQEWVYRYLHLEGSFTITPEAKAFHKDWYDHRPAPDDDKLEPSFNRSDEMVHRLALLLAIAELPLTFEQEATCDKIDVRHLKEAIELYESLGSDTCEVMRLASSNARCQEATIMEAILSRLKVADLSTLSQRAHGKGLDREGRDRGLAYLIDQGKVRGPVPRQSQFGRTVRVYEWVEEEEATP